jgi:hypothetical protein
VVEKGVGRGAYGEVVLTWGVRVGLIVAGWTVVLGKEEHGRETEIEYLYVDCAFNVKAVARAYAHTCEVYVIDLRLLWYFH